MIPDDSMFSLFSHSTDMIFYSNLPPTFVGREALQKKLCCCCLWPWHRCKYLTAALAHNEPSDEYSLDATCILGSN